MAKQDEVKSKYQLLTTYLSYEEQKKHLDASYLTIMSLVCAIGLPALSSMISHEYNSPGWKVAAFGFLIISLLSATWNYTVAENLERTAKDREINNLS